MKVLVLMSTYNGEKYLEEQIESILQQRGLEVSILVRDDGSSDGTLELLSRYAEEKCILYYQGKNLGPAFSFFDLMKNAKRRGMEFDYYAFADQDDVWEEDKLSVAIARLEEQKVTYRMYASAVKLVDQELKLLGVQQAEVYDFPEYFLRNQCAGCTMVFNGPVLTLMTRYQPKYLEMHDVWMLRILRSVEDAVVYVDSNSYICYRQHGNNVVGGGHGKMYAIRLKFRQLFGEEIGVYQTALELLQGYSGDITEEARKFLEEVVAAKQSFRGRLHLLKRICGEKFSRKSRKVFCMINVVRNNL